MAILTSVTHITHYKYDRLVSLAPQSVRLRPSPHCKIPIKSYSLKISPAEHFLNWYQDIYGNWVANIVFPEKINEFKIEVDVKAEVRIINPFDFFIDKQFEDFPFSYDEKTKEELFAYLKPAENSKILMDFISELIGNNKKQNLSDFLKNKFKKRNTIDFIVEINRKVNKALNYIIRLEHGVYSCEETLTKKYASCRDMAWLLCNIFRHLGIAARFVSGYLVQLKADEKPVDSDLVGVENDVVDLHAWTEIYMPGAGWVGLDATSGLLAGEGHIPLSAAPHYENAAPVSGLIDYCESTMHHHMEVHRAFEDARVTKPLSDIEWNEIEALAKEVDADIKKNDIRLTLGGEPTFVSSENRDAPEWNVAAMGEEKIAKSIDLLFRLRNKFAKGASLQFGQGKWYGGETLPRYAYGCFFRLDGQPIWANENLIASPKPINENEKIYNLADAKKFIENLTNALGIAHKAIIPAYEDVPYNLLRERILPLTGKIIKNAEKDDEIKRLLNLNKNELGKPKGFVLPLLYSVKRKKWISNLWKFRSKHLLLISGDSPIGLRLPMASVPYVKAGEQEIPPYRSNFDDLENFENYEKIKKKFQQKISKKASEKENSYLNKDENGYVRTALCVEVRKGKIFVFLPPLYYFEHYLELISALEVTAEALGFPIVLEGYEPPRDYRTKHFHITPDPGVIEVNVAPAKDWEELKFINNTLYEEAKYCKLTAEKFMLDGRSVGTGGGNHIVVGGATPSDSPFLRRPDLIKSLLLFWQNHPSLSYLFSSIFIGPTSQAPRIDEARNDSLYELEIALNQIDKTKNIPFWLIDRLLRNILVDLTGNTHRTEICIDKLYAPDGERGRLGLLEFRGFEMTPHARMNLLQILLLRAIISSFWQKPYDGKLIRWGTNLHDRFMLPHFVWEDFSSVLAELENRGYKFDKNWFLAQYNFRFPRYGVAQIGDCNIELKMALEPWPVLGEEATSFGTSRGVDSAIERLQVKIEGLDNNKFALLVNGYEYKPQNLSADKNIFGVRFKAWQPVLTLHPNLPVNSPLVFDVINRKTGVAIGGCKYHIVHQGGRAYEKMPVNVNEAEGRMISRFETIGHSQRKIKIKEYIPSPDFPLTLDLRRV